MKIHKALLKGSIILLISFGVYNFLNFLMQFFMARMLSIADFGIFATLSAMIYILAVFVESIQTIITKYSSNEKNEGRLKNLLRKSLRKSGVVSFLLFIVYAVISIPLVFLLNINYYLLALNGLIIFTSFFLPITRGIMQGGKRFKALGGNMMFESAMRLVLAVFFVFLGWRVYGAILGGILGAIFAFGLSLIPLKKVLKAKEMPSKTTGIYEYAGPAFFVTLSIIVFYSIDIIIAKIVFSPDIAGAYAVASILSKAIFWGTQPISRVMFPLSAESDKNIKKSNNIFFNSLVLLFLALIVALLIFYFLSSLIVFVFAGRIIEEAVAVLFYVGVATSLVSITNLTLLHRLSLNKIKKNWAPLLLIFVLIEASLLFYFSNDLLQFSIAFIVASTIFLWGSITFFGK